MEFPAPLTSARYVAAGLLALVCALALGLGSVFVATPRLEYRLDADALTVDARLGWLDQGRRIPRAALENPRSVRLAWSRRLVGTAVPGYCQGRFEVAELGKVWLATSCSPEVVALDTPDGVVLISPADRRVFLRALATDAAGTFSPPSGGRLGLPQGLLAILLAPLLPVPFIAWRLTRRLVYRIEGATLVVPGLLWAARLELAGARARREPLRKAWRVAGAALPGLYLGWFRAQGGSVHVAATQLDDGVFVEGSRRVFVTPHDVAGFLAAVEKAGAITGPRAFEGS